MSAQKAKELLLKTDVSGTMELVGGMKAKSIKINNGMTDITATDSPGTWRELMPEANTQSLTVTGSGVFKSTAGHNEVMDAALANTFVDMEFVVPGFGKFTGSFAVPSYDWTGGEQGEVSFSTTFESAGAVTFAAAA
jgi:TP901-1 family phage major tail protein